MPPLGLVPIEAVRLLCPFIASLCVYMYIQNIHEIHGNFHCDAVVNSIGEANFKIYGPGGTNDGAKQKRNC